jgi:glycosyltransferase involved in cell wall biosynthesis
MTCEITQEPMSTTNEPSSSRVDPVVLHTRVVTGSGGGPDKTILNSPRHLVDFGYSAVCAYMRAPGDEGFAELQRRADGLDAQLVAVDDRGPLDMRVPRRLLQLCREHDVKIWHGHDYKSNAIGLLLRRFWPMQLVTTVHGWVHNTRRTPLYYWIDRFSLRHYDHVVCVSDDLHQRCLEIGVPNDRCTLIENAIDVQSNRRDKSTEQAKQQLGLDVDRPLVGAVGRLSPEKGFDTLIKAIHQLRSEGLDVNLAIAGEGDQHEALRSLVDKLDLNKHVYLLGFQSNANDLYQASDVYALSSYREGLPNVVLEAMAMEVPVVATRVAGVPSIIKDGENGLIVAPGDVEQLTQGLARLLKSNDLRSRFAAAGRRTVEERFCFAKRMAKMRDIYDKVLSDEAPHKL